LSAAALDAGGEAVQVVPERRESEGGISLVFEIYGGVAVAGSIFGWLQRETASRGSVCAREQSG